MLHGGIKKYVGSTSWSLDARRITVEGDSVNPLPPAAWLVNPNRFGSAYFEDLRLADAYGSEAVVKIGDSDAMTPTVRQGRDVITVVNCRGTIKGSAHVVNSPANPLANHGVGWWWGGRIAGQHDAARRAFSPSVARAANLVPTDPLDFQDAPTTTALPAPDGTSGAARFTSGGDPVIFTVLGQLVSLVAGDYVVVAAWVKSDASPPFPLSSSIRLETHGSGLKKFFLSGTNSIVPFSKMADGRLWYWLVEWDTWIGDRGTFTLDFQVRVDDGVSLDVYMPQLYHLPGTEWSNAEVGEFATNLVPVPNTSEIGDISTLRGQTFRHCGRSLYSVSTFADGDSTPSVSSGDFWITANTSKSNVSNLDDGRVGQEVTICARDGNTTIVHGAGLYLKSKVNRTLERDETIRFVMFEANRWDEV